MRIRLLLVMLLQRSERTSGPAVRPDKQQELLGQRGGTTTVGRQTAPVASVMARGYIQLGGPQERFMPIKGLVYVSEASDELRGDVLGLRGGRLDALADDALRFNRDAGVSGVLLFDGTRFLQYLEGPADGVDVAFSRVLGASSHHDVIELHRGTVADRRLPYWPMRWLPVEVKELTEIAVADWAGFKVRGDGEALNATAIDRMLFMVSKRALIGGNRL